MPLRPAWHLLRDAFAAWSEHRASTLGAALAFYALFSIAPLAMVAIAVAGLVLGEEAAHGLLFAQIAAYIGPAGAQAIESLVATSRDPADGVLAGVVGAATLLAGATAIVGELKADLDQVWDTPRSPSSALLKVARTRLRAALVVFAGGGVMIASVAASTALSTASRALGSGFDAAFRLLESLNFGVSLLAMTLLAAAVYKLLPEVRLAWRDVWVGALITASLLAAGKHAIGFYLGRTAVDSAYGAAGSLVVVMVWAYWSAQIFLFGAEVTRLWATRYGSRRDDDAVRT